MECTFRALYDMMCTLEYNHTTKNLECGTAPKKNGRSGRRMRGEKRGEAGGGYLCGLLGKHKSTRIFFNFLDHLTHNK